MSFEQPKKSKEEMERKCPTCKGTGKFKPPGAKRTAVCQKCGGKGYTFKA